MPHPAVNTKVELVVESIEDMCVAVASRDCDAVLAARKECTDRLREFLRPALRVVENVDPGQRVE